MAKGGAKAWMKHGALDYKECVIDDAKPMHVTRRFCTVVRVKPSALLFYALVVFKSRAHRDMVNKKVMADPLMNDPQWKDKPMPMDMKRMAYGGFKVIVDGK